VERNETLVAKEADRMKQVIELRVNGDLFEIAVKPDELLLDVLRDRLGLTGAKRGCGKGQCGSCTVLIDGEASKSCLIKAVKTQDKDITTIEGLGKEGKLDPVQKAFVEYGAVQCGYCTPGMIMAAEALLQKTHTPNREEIKKALAGNLCRCTGYVKIIEAVEAAAAEICEELASVAERA
jgi:carbon-monoxide dehydrogenase small subunit